MLKNRAQTGNKSADWLLTQLYEVCNDEYKIETPEFLFLVAMNNVPAWQSEGEKGEYRRNPRVSEKVDILYANEVEGIRRDYLYGSKTIELIKEKYSGPNFNITSDFNELGKAIEKWEVSPETEFDYYEEVNGNLVFVLVEFIWTP